MAADLPQWMRSTGVDEAEQSAISLLGMSGVGKSTIAGVLAGAGYRVISIDRVIERILLEPERAPDPLDEPDSPKPPNRALADVRVLSTFVGLPGATSSGGLPWNEFIRRQELYGQAERRATDLCIETVRDSKDRRRIVIDSTGSCCQLPAASLYRLREVSSFTLLGADDMPASRLWNRANDSPKPLLFPSGELMGWLKEYVGSEDLDQVDHMSSEDFLEWVFPRLASWRQHAYGELIRTYGGTIVPSRAHSQWSASSEVVRALKLNV